MDTGMPATKQSFARIFGIFLSLFICLGCLQAASAAELNLYTEITGISAFRSNDELTGYGVEMVREMQRRIGRESKITVLPWARAYELLETTPGTGLFVTARTEERDRRFHWVGPLMRLQWVFLAKKDSGVKISSLVEAKDVGTIGTYIGDVRDTFLRQQGFKNLDRSTSNVLNFRKLVEGRLDLVASSPTGLVETARQAGVDPNDLEICYVIKETDLYLAISGGTALATVNNWKTAFRSMQNDGTFAEIFSKWHPLQEPPMDVRRPWLGKPFNYPTSTSMK